MNHISQSWDELIGLTDSLLRARCERFAGEGVAS